MKLDLILENVRNKYNMGLLEESSLSELDILKGKVMINESTMQIRKMLVEEGTMEDVKAFLEESWSYDLYEEMAVHAEHSWLDKSRAKGTVEKNTVPVVSKTLGKTIMVDKTSDTRNIIQKDRDHLAERIKYQRTNRDADRNTEHRARYANLSDNNARLLSQAGTHNSSPNTYKTTIHPFMDHNSNLLERSPRLVPISKSGISAQEQESRDLGFIK